jgi:hypothetical protein
LQLLLLPAVKVTPVVIAPAPLAVPELVALPAPEQVQGLAPEESAPLAVPEQAALPVPEQVRVMLVEVEVEVEVEAAVGEVAVS